MNVSELDALASWYAERRQDLITLYRELTNPVSHNASQPNKQAIEPQLDALIAYLRQMTFEELSLEQLAVLQDRGAAAYLGKAGADFVEATIKTSDYDPATAASRLNRALATLEGTGDALTAYATALQGLEIDLEQFEPEDGAITIRVGFKREASIENVADWKNSARDWYDIVRGLAMAVDEPPEATKVVGASTGSIILYLVATATVSFLLARISKHITSITKDIISIETMREELRQKKLLTKVIDLDLKEQIEAKKSQALEIVMNEVKASAPKAKGEASVALGKSVQKLLAFSRKGGDVDFVAPPAEKVDEEGDEHDTPKALAEARAAIEEYQAARDAVRLLTDGTANDNDG